MRTLEGFGFEWDTVIRQSEGVERYDAALHALKSRELTFECSCSRMQLEEELRYPGTCRERRAPGGLATAVRLRVEPGHIQFADRIQGIYRQDVSAAVGDIIIKRRDRIFAYVLAVVVDDASQGITHVVRGADLLDNTPRQIHLQKLLRVPQPSYAHVPVLTEADDSKLAKSRRSAYLGPHSPAKALLSVFSLLGLTAPESLRDAPIREAWEWGISKWNVDKVPKRLNLRVEPA